LNITDKVEYINLFSFSPAMLNTCLCNTPGEKKQEKKREIFFLVIQANIQGVHRSERGQQKSNFRVTIQLPQFQVWIYATVTRFIKRSFSVWTNSYSMDNANSTTNVPSAPNTTHQSKFDSLFKAVIAKMA